MKYILWILFPSYLVGNWLGKVKCCQYYDKKISSSIADVTSHFSLPSQSSLYTIKTNLYLPSYRRAKRNYLISCVWLVINALLHLLVYLNYGTIASFKWIIIFDVVLSVILFLLGYKKGYKKYSHEYSNIRKFFNL